MNDDNLKEELFGTLRARREEKGISLEEIARKYRIQLKYLQAIEQGNISELPAAYDHLFFRSYLKALQADEQEYMERFYSVRDQVRGRTAKVTLPAAPGESARGVRFKFSELMKSKNLYVAVPFAVVFIILIVLIGNIKNVPVETDIPVREIDVQSIAASLQPPVAADTVDSVQAAVPKLNLLINGLKTTWFRVVTDKKDTSEFMLRRGNRMTVQADKTFELVTGRADGLQFSVNNKPPQHVGSDSLVVTYLLIDSSGIVMSRLKQPKVQELQTDSTAVSTHEIH